MLLFISYPIYELRGFTKARIMNATTLDVRRYKAVKHSHISLRFTGLHWHISQLKCW
jgi:hypothetical protein